MRNTPESLFTGMVSILIPLLILCAAAPAFAGDNENDNSPEWLERLLPPVSTEDQHDACRDIRRSFTSPVATRHNEGIRSGYEHRINPFSGERELHFGVDIRSREGVPVRATADGVVRQSYVHHAYSHVVIIEHAGGAAGPVTTLSAHLQERHVERGEEVHQGDLIGTLGETGDATNPHLHFELFRSGPYGNPTLDAVAGEGQSHFSPRGNIYYDPALLFCDRIGTVEEHPQLDWFLDTRAPVSARPRLDSDGTLYLASGGGTIHGVSDDTGEEQWVFEAGAPVRSSPRPAGEGLLILGKARGGVTALDRHDGAVVWERPHRSPVAADVVSDGDSAWYATGEHVYAVSVDDGEERWAEPRAEPPYTSVGQESVLTDSYLVTRDTSKITARGRESGDTAWETNPDARALYGLAVDDERGTVVATGIDGSVFSLDSRTGAVQWEQSLETDLYTDPVITGEKILVGGGDGYVRALSADSGAKVWTRFAGSAVDANPFPVDNWIFVGTNDGEILVLERSSGRITRRKTLPGAERILATPIAYRMEDGGYHLYVGVEGVHLSRGDGLFRVHLSDQLDRR